jgi:hypothetical protein
MKRSVMRRPVIGWQRLEKGTFARGVIAYRGDLSGAGLRVHYGFDGWQEPIREVRLESIEPGLAVAELPDIAEHVTIDCAITDGDRWDNNTALTIGCGLASTRSTRISTSVAMDRAPWASVICAPRWPRPEWSAG